LASGTVRRQPNFVAAYLNERENRPQKPGNLGNVVQIKFRLQMGAAAEGISLAPAATPLRTVRKKPLPRSGKHKRLIGNMFLLERLRDEWFLGFSGGTCLVFLLYGDTPFARLAEPTWLALIFLWLFMAVLGSALSICRHAEQLASRLGEPYGTLLLTRIGDIRRGDEYCQRHAAWGQQSNPGPRHTVCRGDDHPQRYGRPVAAGGRLAPS